MPSFNKHIEVGISYTVNGYVAWLMIQSLEKTVFLFLKSYLRKQFIKMLNRQPPRDSFHS